MNHLKMMAKSWFAIFFMERDELKSSILTKNKIIESNPRHKCKPSPTFSP
jgi:hypothetical protein